MSVTVSDGRKKKRELNDNVYALWSVWCSVTQRDKRAVEPTENFIECAEEWLQEGYSYDELSDTVKAAAYLRPNKTDKFDVLRVVYALDDEKIEYQAKQARKAGKEIYLYTPYEPDYKIMRDELAEILEGDEYLWDEEDEVAAAWIMERMTREKCLELRDEIMSAGEWYHDMEPETFLRFKRTRKWRENIGSTSPVSNNSYKDGKRESRDLDEVDFSVDEAANELYIRTGSVRRTIDFHNQAPEDYWDAVGEVMDEEDCSAAEAYDVLEDEFEWHPDDREE